MNVGNFMMLRNKIVLILLLLLVSLFSFAGDKSDLLSWKMVGLCKSILKTPVQQVFQLHDIASLVKEDSDINGFSVALPKIRNRQKKRYIGIQFQVRYYPVQKDALFKQISVQDFYTPYAGLLF